MNRNMLLLSPEKFRKLTDFLLLNAYSMNNVGIVNGKAGIALTLFEAARLLKDDGLEEHAFDVLQAALVSSASCSFTEGKAGIGYTLWYLIQYGFIEGDYGELFGEQHQQVIRELIKMDAKKMDVVECARLLCFLSRIPGCYDQRQQAVEKLMGCIGDYCSRIMSDIIGEKESFFRMSAILLPEFSCLKELSRGNEVRCRLQELAGKVRNSGCVCHSLWYAEGLMNCELREYEMKRWGREALEEIVQNSGTSWLTISELIDLHFCLMGKDGSVFGDKRREIEAWLSEEEETRFPGGNHPGGQVGVEKGIARLLLAAIGDTGTAERERITEILRLTF